MNLKQEKLSDSRVKLTITAETSDMSDVKKDVVNKLGRELKIQGFRAGKAPENIVEKSLDQNRLQSEFIDAVINKLYGEALKKENIRPVDRPEVNVTKFVPFSNLEFVIEVDHIGDIVLPDYKTLLVDKPTKAVSAKNIDEVIDQLAVRDASKKKVPRAAKDTDEVTIDFSGVDAKTGEPIKGADGKDFPLVLGSNTFIPGFEPELIGLKEAAKKSFDIVFPGNYQVAALQNRKVTFSILVKDVKEMSKPKIDDAFAKKIGPFKTLLELKADIKKQLQVERDRETRAKYENDLVLAIAEKTKVSIPKVLIEEQIDLMERDEKQNLIYRGTTWEEHLKAEGLSNEQHRDRNRDQAENLVKMGLVLSEIAEKENISVTPEELDIRIQMLKGQYPDQKMQAELDKLENSRNITNQILTEKTMAKIVSYNS
jgi:trigger factor